MRLQMYLGDELVDSVAVTLIGPPSSNQRCLQEEISDLLNKHKKKLSNSSTNPTFVLEGVPSSINHFQSLRG